MVFNRVVPNLSYTKEGWNVESAGEKKISRHIRVPASLCRWPARSAIMCPRTSRRRRGDYSRWVIKVTKLNFFRASSSVSINYEWQSARVYFSPRVIRLDRIYITTELRILTEFKPYESSDPSMITTRSRKKRHICKLIQSYKLPDNFNFYQHARFSKDRLSDSHTFGFLAIGPITKTHSRVFYTRFRVHVTARHATSRWNREWDVRYT